VKVGYFVNQYPKVSHTFIRREILALERQGITVARYALRGWEAEVRGDEDLQGRGRTRHVLAQGLPALLLQAARTALTRPARFWQALRAAGAMSRQAERPWPYHLMYLVEACTLRRWLARDGIDHVHAHFGTNSAEVVLLAHLLGGPRYSFTVHGPEEFDKPAFLHLADKVRHAAFVVAISSYGRSQLWRHLRHDMWAVEVVHCGLEKAFHEVAQVAVPAAPRLVCVGRLCEQKGQLMLLQAARLLAERGRDFDLVLAGDGEMRGEIETLIARYGLGERVRITGWIGSHTVRAELQAARALVLPSFAEGLPVVIMEAMALRRPVLTTTVAGIPELVRPGENGWLFPAGAVEELAASLEDFLAQPPEVLQRMGDSARERVLQRHDIDLEAGKLAALFRRSA